MIKTFGWVAKVWDQGGEGGWWSPHFSRHFHDWKIEGVTALVQMQQKCSIRSEEEDKLGGRNPKMACQLNLSITL